MFTPYNVLFYLKKRNTYKSGSAPIYLSVDGQRTEVSVGRDCDPSRWNSHAGRATGNKEDVRALNTFLDSVQSKLNVAHDSKTHPEGLHIFEMNVSIQRI